MRCRMAMVVVGAASVVALGCSRTDGPSSPTPPGSTSATVRIVFVGPTARRSDLPPSAQECVGGDVPANTRVSFRINDQNACDENPTGAVTRNVLVNDVRLIQNATTPGNSDEPGFAFMVTANGTVTQ